MFCVQLSFAQTNKEKARELGLKAVTLMDSGEIEESLKLLKEATKLDPDNFNYPYETAYANYAKQDYKTAIKILEKLKTHKDVEPALFQLLGNSYDMTGKRELAFEAYDEGIAKFPNSGSLYLEKGNVHWALNEYNKALDYYEKGIEMDPKFPSNYYRATRIYCNSSEEVWGMIYGEIFMNLERNSKRTVEISKLLFDTYKKEIKFTSDSTMSVSFSQNATINIDDLSSGKDFKLPYGIGVYEPTLIMSLIGVKAIDINTLDGVRTRFLDAYYKGENYKSYPNVLFDYQKRIQTAGHLEAYNHWILMKGDETNFKAWQIDNKKKWDDFVTWFTENGLVIDQNNRFSTSQY